MGELRVARPGVWTNERRLVSDGHDPSATEVLRLSPDSKTGSAVESSKASSSRS
jgi:hypothetical protein